jgi:hypothetical protein
MTVSTPRPSVGLEEALGFLGPVRREHWSP